MEELKQKIIQWKKDNEYPLWFVCWRILCFADHDGFLRCLLHGLRNFRLH